MIYRPIHIYIQRGEAGSESQTRSVGSESQSLQVMYLDHEITHHWGKYGDGYLCGRETLLVAYRESPHAAVHERCSMPTRTSSSWCVAQGRHRGEGIENNEAEKHAFSA